jgi:ElaB/YqjD/DUF883 family membrane-anchored ribosome-binding protein
LESKHITIELRDEKGQESMTQSVLEQVGVQIDETARKASRAASVLADALEDGGEAARRVTKQGSHAAAELLAETKKRVQRHPIETVAAVFAAGIMAGSDNMSEEGRNIGSTSLAISRCQPVRLRTRCILP